ncbi:HET-domain-containing protein [Lentithecium fluviatile CBS 122367]|uniref:HET-domain-containing protein n=1 Tax=Lentithecium fluviatile CBS 122367 TaxID=1168545 RepID=A0A6G1IFY8_9PLEO|nr:HET-domain-containing protein [Lentithecium fluviatile CBS 122367]
MAEVSTLMTQAQKNGLISWIHENARKIFAITVQCRLEVTYLVLCMLHFQQCGFKDTRLPVGNPRPPDKMSQPPVPPEYFHEDIWSRSMMYDFYDKQWKYLAPVFTPNQYNYNLSPACILPFTSRSGQPKAGPFGTVHRVKIHNFWDQTPEQVPSRENIEQATKQLRGLADALHHLHEFDIEDSDRAELREKSNSDPSSVPAVRVNDSLTPTPDSSRRGRNRVNDEHNEVGDYANVADEGSIRHGDLKPENILRFSGQIQGLGVLKIADMSLAKRHSFATQMESSKMGTRFDAVRYEAPEAVTNAHGARSRLCDIWSMGCITLEFVIWILYGNDELINFNNQVDLLDVVRTKLLVVDLPPNRPPSTTGFHGLAPPGPDGEKKLQRATAAQLRDALHEILAKLKGWELLVDNRIPEKLATQQGFQALSHQSPVRARLCKRCLMLDFWLGGFGFNDKILDLQERSTICDFCKMLYEVCMEKGEDQADIVRFTRNQSTLILANSEGLPAFSIFRSPQLKPPFEVQIGLPELPVAGSDIFFEIIKLWLEDCVANHPLYQIVAQDRFPTRVIDIGTLDNPQLRLLETSEEGISCRDYIALTHPWGDPEKSPPYSTMRKDPSGAGREIENFKKSIPHEQLPQTFKDAVFCTRALKIRYLWIDSLCIIQGEDGDFNEEAKYMEDVFSGAYCVLAASRATNRHDGFLGPRLHRTYVTFQRGSEMPFYMCRSVDNFSQDVIEGSLNRRGWVLQERALARRTVYFTENQTYFECGNGVRCETMAKMHNHMADFLGDPNFPDKAMRTPSRALKISYFQELYRQYSRLAFTRYEDRPFAIAGLEKRLQKAFGIEGSFSVFYDGPDGGLFHRSLLWQRGEQPEDEAVLTPIDFPIDRNIKVPSYLTGTVRDFNTAGRKRDEVRLRFDVEKPATDGQRAQCVVFAKEREGRSDRDKRHYVLLVASTQNTTEHGEKVYKRIGAGFMSGKYIALDKPGIMVKIY